MTIKILKDMYYNIQTLRGLVLCIHAQLRAAILFEDNYTFGVAVVSVSSLVVLSLTSLTSFTSFSLGSLFSLVMMRRSGSFFSTDGIFIIADTLPSDGLKH